MLRLSRTASTTVMPSARGLGFALHRANGPPEQYKLQHVEDGLVPDGALGYGGAE